METSNVTRFEVIDGTTGGEGRILARYGVSVELALQDDGLTLKAFLTDSPVSRDEVAATMITRLSEEIGGD